MEYALNHGLDLGFNVVRLVDHVGDATGVGVALGLRADDLVEDAEEVKRVLRANHQVIIGIASVVEVEAAQPLFVEQVRDNLGDIGALPHENLPFFSSSRHFPTTLLWPFLQDHNSAHLLGSGRRILHSDRERGRFFIRQACISLSPPHAARMT